MDEILSDLLVLARLDSGELAVAREPFNLADAVVETADRFAKRAAARGVRLAVETSGKTRATPANSSRAAMRSGQARFWPLSWTTL